MTIEEKQKIISQLNGDLASLRLSSYKKFTKSFLEGYESCINDLKITLNEVNT